MEDEPDEENSLLTTTTTTTTTTTKNIESSAVIRLILQFLKESNLKRTFHCLQEESSVALNAVDSLDDFESACMKGKWDSVIQTAGEVKMPDEALYLLYEQIVVELVEMEEFSIALLMLRETAALQSLRVCHPLKYKRLDQLANCGRSHIDAKELYEGLTKEKRRLNVARALMPHIQQVSPSRLLTLISSALKWQEQHDSLIPSDSNYDLFRGVVVGEPSNEERPVDVVVRTIKFSSSSHPQCAVFSPNGKWLVTGASDGLIEIWDFQTGKLAVNFEFQKKECFMLHQSSILSLCFTEDSSYLASSCNEGHIKIWKLSTGQCVKKFEKAHDMGVCSLAFNMNSTQILSGSFDCLARIHGLKSGKTLRDFRGHNSYVNAAVYLCDDSRVVTGSSDAMVKVWDSKTADCLLSLVPPPPPHLNAAITLAVNSLILNPKSAADNPSDSFFVCTQSSVLYLMNTAGQLLKRYSSGKQKEGDFISACVSPRSRWIYAVGEDQVLYTFNGISSTLESVKKLEGRELLGIIHHPSSSLVASYSCSGNLCLIQA